MRIPLLARLACLAMVPYLLTHSAPARTAPATERFAFSISARGLDVELVRGSSAAR